MFMTMLIAVAAVDEILAVVASFAATGGLFPISGSLLDLHLPLLYCL
jgi:hypothetical protein